MQDRYAGDIGDFGKFGLLRYLKATGYSLGVNWYLPPDESNGDGKLTKYLENTSEQGFRKYDEVLWAKLKTVVSTDRSVCALERADILNATYYHDRLDFDGLSRQERDALRTRWHQKALKQLKNLDIVFLDPDNGIIVPSACHTRRESKYILRQELIDYYKQGSSIIYYQHKARRGDLYYTDQHKSIVGSSEFEGSSSLAVKFTKTSLRYYFFIIRPEHRQIMEPAVKSFLTTDWKDLFCEVPLN